MKHLLIICCVSLTATACSVWPWPHHLQGGVVAECCGVKLTEAELQPITHGLSSEDSAVAAQQYIHQWACDILEWEQAKKSANKQIEMQVEAYRKTLLLQTYQEHIIQQYMPKEIADSVVAQFYHEHIDYFTLREPIVKGAILTIPIQAPHQSELKKHLQTLEEEPSIEAIEKYAYQYASGYELFTDNWRTASQILLRMPFQKDDLEKQLKQKKCIELSDSVTTYVLQVTDWCPSSAPMPLDYAYSQIQQLILTQRQASFLRQERDELFRQAQRLGKIKQHNE